MRAGPGRKQKGARSGPRTRRAESGAAGKTSKRKKAPGGKLKVTARKKASAKKGPAGKKGTGASRAGKAKHKPRKKRRFPIDSPKASEILLHLEDLMHERILGKDRAVERIAMVLRVRLTQLHFRPERPNGSFLLVGPPGVGKNEFAYALANIFYGDETVVTPIDMRAISSEEDASRLIDTIITGPQPVLLEGLITTSVRRRPYTILLLQGIEHAHPAALRLIQQIVGHGRIDDARGRVSFQHTIIFATSRVPEDESGPTSQIGFTRKPMNYEERVIEKVTHRLGEEFVEAFEEVLVIPALTPDDVRRIARYKVDVVLRRLQMGRRGVEVSESVYQQFIPDEEANRAGAGMLNRTLEMKLLNPLARYLLQHPKERQIRVDVRNGSLVIEPGRSVKRSGGAAKGPAA